MSEAKNNYAGEDIQNASDLNINAKNTNDAGGFRDSILAAEVITAFRPIFLDATAGKWKYCDANDTARLNFDGFALEAGAVDTAMKVQLNGIVRGFTGLSVGSKYYVQDAVGTIGTNVGTQPILVGIAISATELIIIKSPLYKNGVVADLSTIEAGNNDVTVTLGFKPRKIILHYYIQGHDSAVQTASYMNETGIAIYNGTTLKIKRIIGEDVTGANENSAPTHFTNTPNSTSAPLKGNTSGTGSIQITIAINSLTDTGFVIRRATAISDNPSTARAKIAYEAFE